MVCNSCEQKYKQPYYNYLRENVLLGVMLTIEVLVFFLMEFGGLA